MAKRIIEYYLPLHENDEYCKKILGELNTYFFTSTKGLEEKSLINLLILSIHLINRLLEEPYCGIVSKKDDFTEQHFSIDNNELYKYQELCEKIDEMSQLEQERYQADEDYSEWSDTYCDLHYDSLSELKKEISVNQIVSVIRAKKCHDYLYELDDQILNIRSKPLNIKTVITVEKKRRIYKVLKEIRIVELEKSIAKTYVDDFQLKRIEQLDGCFEYLCSAEDYWNTTMVRDSNRIDYTPYVANYIKLIEILLIEIIKKYIERKIRIGKNVIFKASNGSLINLTNEKEIHFVTLGDILHFIKRYDDIIILDNQSIVFDYLYYFKDKIRNSKFHTSIISNFQEAYEIRYNALSILKRILYDIY